MSIVEQLKAQGFKPVESTDGEWIPYKGTYGVTWSALRKERDEKNNADFIQAEFEIDETLEGDPKRESKYPAFRQRFYLDGEKGAENMQKLCNWAFTFGVDADMTGDDDGLIASLQQAVGKKGYIRAWGWTPKDSDKPMQSFVVQKSSVAEKKRSSASIPF